ncbi:dihydrofolate reductase [Bacillus pakistanensis]|uniref:Dihydrofolate reductase n=1 Tax=Rossellomorea pakistanensis TaxID=992288 RepID=A0ABS2NH04_9BACI|nr:dihydrofolate reductase family protein [Bacillus pakistanensis]MBM7587145.1 dihydrofolate reductase [Bacillus pakistanensis]
MTELIYHVATTVDHFIADPSGVADQSIFFYEGDHASDFISAIQQYDAVLMGGKTYEWGFQYGLKPGEPGYKGLKHYIFSKTMDFESNDEVELVKTDAAEFIKKLKQNTDQKIWLCGGGQLAGSLLDHQLIDTLILKVNPVLIGDGIPLFGSSKKQIHLELRSLKKYENGVIVPTYKILYYE